MSKALSHQQEHSSAVGIGSQILIKEKGATGQAYLGQKRQLHTGQEMATLQAKGINNPLLPLPLPHLGKMNLPREQPALWFQDYKGRKGDSSTGHMPSGSQDSAGEGPAGICTVGAKMRTIKGRCLIYEEDQIGQGEAQHKPLKGWGRDCSV